MSLWLMIPLMISLTGVYFSLNIPEEVFRLMALIIALIVFILNLAVMPWFIKLLILILILLTNKKASFFL